MRPAVDRRAFLSASAAGLLLPARPALAGLWADKGFTHGVASGDPGATSIKLWTRYASSDGRDAVLKVANTGTGIPPEMRDRVFERFFRADSSRPNTRGHGLGLALCWEIVELHGGRLNLVADQDAELTVFEVRLPAPRPSHTQGSSGTSDTA